MIVGTGDVPWSSVGGNGSYSRPKRSRSLGDNVGRAQGAGASSIESRPGLAAKAGTVGEDLDLKLGLGSSAQPPTQLVSPGVKNFLALWEEDLGILSFPLRVHRL